MTTKPTLPEFAQQVMRHMVGRQNADGPCNYCGQTPESISRGLFGERCRHCDRDVELCNDCMSLGRGHRECQRTANPA